MYILTLNVAVFKENFNPATGKIELGKTNADLESLICRARDQKLEHLRTDGTYPELKLCADLCLSTMVEKNSWKMNRGKINLSSLMTVSDEAFALLVLENNICEWMYQVEQTEVERAVKKRKLSRYTGKGQNVDGTTKGWSMEGKRRFNVIYDMVNDQRTVCKSREELLRNEWNREDNESDIRRRVTKDGSKDEEVVRQEIKRIQEEESFVPRGGFNI